MRINTTGFCSTSSPVAVCEECMTNQWNGDTHFVRIANDLFWSINADYGEFETLEEVRSKSHYVWLVEKRLSSHIDKKLLTDVMFVNDRYGR